MPSWPPSVSDFKGLFVREFIYGPGTNTVMDADIQRSLNEASLVFNPNLWGSVTERSIAYMYLGAHFMARNIQAAGGLSALPRGRGVDSRGGGSIESKGVGAVNIGYAVPDFVRQSPILSQFMQTDFGQRYLQLLCPRLVGNVMVVSGGNDTLEFAGKVAPLAITTLALPDGTHGVAYLQAVIATGGVAPLNWQVTSGALPAGLILSAVTGALSGTPTTAGIYFFGVTVTDSLGATSSMNYKLVIA